MNVEDLLKLRAAGLSHYKDRDIELRFDGASPKADLEAWLPPAGEPHIYAASNAERIKQNDDKEIIHKVEEMTSLLKLGDKELVDRLFPEGDAEESSTDE